MRFLDEEITFRSLWSQRKDTVVNCCLSLEPQVFIPGSVMRHPFLNVTTGKMWKCYPFSRREPKPKD